VVVIAAVAIALLVAGIARVGHQSGPYDASVNRSFAVQGTLITEESNATASSLRQLWRTMQNEQRPALQSALDTAVAQSAQQAAEAAALAGPDLPGDVQGQFAAVFAARAEAVRRFRAAVDGLLGLRPLAVAGAPDPGAPAAAPTLLSSTEVTNRITGAGALLSRADRGYAAVRRALAGLPGHPRIPASRWITNVSLWQLGPVAAQVDLVAASSSLAIFHRIYLRTIELSPPAVPSSTAPPGVSVVPPTSTVTLSVVVSNQGTVDEPHVAVRYTLTPQPAGATTTATRSAAVAAGDSLTLPTVTFRVKPGHNYQLNVTIASPSGQSALSGTTLAQVLQIDPST
jgi:hypothetical protein